MAKPLTAARSPEREALAARHAQKAERDREGAAIRQAYEAADEATYSIAAQMDAILAIMRDRPVMLIGNALTGKNVDADPEGFRVLRDKLESHQADLDDTKTLRSVLRAQMDEDDNRYDYPAQHIREAATVVLQAETADMVAAAVADIMRMSNEIARLRADLLWLSSHHVFGELPHEVPPDVSEALAPMHDGALRLWNGMRSASPWAGVLDGLAADPDYVLPTPKKAEG